MQVLGDHLKTRKRTGSIVVKLFFDQKIQLKIIYLALKFLVDLQFSLLNMIAKHQQVS